jgi:hypothetical protein
MELLTQHEEIELLEYNEETGKFSRRSHKPCGSINTHGYVVIYIKGKQQYGHRLAWLYMHGQWPTDEVDHINGNRSDNRIINLRVVGKTINLQNIHEARKDSLIGLKGVKKHRLRFQARIRAFGKDHFLGSFKTADEAHMAYVEAKKILHSGAF